MVQLKTHSRPIEKIDCRPQLGEYNGLITFFKALMSDRKARGLSCFNYDVALKYLLRFSNGNEISFKSVNNEWIQAYRKFLLSTSSFKNEQSLTKNSAGTYYSIVINVINEAIQHRELDASVVKNVNAIKRGELKSEALLEEELIKLAEAECDCVSLKKAFLLSSLTGIQWNELKLLTWEHIVKAENAYQIQIGARVIPLTLQAYGLLDKTSTPNELIFDRLKWTSYMYIKMNKWAIRAGIVRNITFQSARLTFARLLHAKGIPTDIIAELLGHKNPKSTLRLTQDLSSIS